MRDSDDSSGPSGAPSGTGLPPRDERSLGDHYRRIHNDAKALATAMQEATAELERYVGEQVEERPYVTLGVAAGVGYVLGGGLRSRLTRVLLGTGTRVAMALVARELAARLSPAASESVQNESSSERVGAGKERS